jgi:hypothetical protein
VQTPKVIKEASLKSAEGETPAAPAWTTFNWTEVSAQLQQQVVAVEQWRENGQEG